MAENDTTSGSAFTDISELEFGPLEQDMHDPEQVKRFMLDLYHSNPNLAKLLLSEAEQAEVGPDTVQEAVIKGGLIIYKALRRHEQTLSITERFAQSMVSAELLPTDTVTT
jgi:hypothetical protein